jgi:flagellar basal body P-ring formation protein FlgA
MNMGKLSITKRILAGLLITAGLLVMGTAPLRASAIGLKENSVITSSTITLGDVFYGLEKDEDKVLGIAPRPGQNMVLSAHTLLRIAVAMDLPWRPATTSDKVTLSRAATVVDRDTIDAALKAKLTESGIPGSYKIVMNNVPDELVLPVDQPATVEVSDMNIKPEKNWFEATLAAPSAANPIQQIKITGSIQNMVEVPVLKTPLRNGTIIGRHDLDLIEMRQVDLGSETILNPAELIGMTPRRVLVSGQPLKASDVESPKIVQRGDTVTMVFQSGPLTLTAQGKALEHGTKGDVIRVVNTGSNKTVEAIVTASKEVSIGSF